MTKWTDEQLNAITKTGKNIIVSAGAGSGKTAVLTERVITKLKSGININNLIVLTFTNAAAFEMKERIKKSIKEIPELKEQLNLIETSSITTFDSFALSLVRKYHYLLNISRNITIIDNVLLEIEKKQILDNIFNDAYSDPNFLDFIDKFTTKDDDKIKTKIDLLNTKLNSITNIDSYLDNYIDNHYNENFIETQYNKYLEILIKTKDHIFKLINSIKIEVTDEILYEFITNIENSLDNNYIDYEDFLQISNYKLTSFPTSKKIDEINIEHIKQLFTKLKENFDTIKNLTIYQNKEEIINEINTTKPYLEVIINLIKQYNHQILEFKTKLNAFEFNDIMRFSINILENNPDILNEIKTNTKEIMVDEYQDTNDIGEYFLSLISDNNLYMVGDVKQSIYKFRNANPKIFTNTYYSYQNGLGISIDLNKNFRSREEVINNINLIFKPIMDDFIGGVKYDSKQELVCGNKEYIQTDNNDMEILNYEYKETDNYKTYTKDEIEIFIIADDIINKMNTFKVYDKNTKSLRNTKYSDFAILLDRKSNFDLYKKIFEYKGIPLTLHKDENFSYTNEMYAIKNLLKLINIFKTNDFRDLKYTFYSLGRSYILAFDDDTLYDNLDNILDCDLYKETIDKLKYLANYSKHNSLSELLIETYKVFDLYLKTIEIGNIEEKNIKLDYLIDVSRNLENIGYDLNDFINYFENMFDLDTDITFSLSKDITKDSVNIMTIHKSKGLEFPICYFASLYKSFNIRDVYDSFLFDNEIGIISPIFKEGIKDTIYKDIIKENYLKEDISERIRVLYVALTRAKEKIIFVSNINDYDDISSNTDMVDDMERLNYKSFLDILLSIKPLLNKYIKNIEYSVTKDYELIKTLNYEEVLLKTNKIYNYQTINVEKKKIDNINYSKVLNEIITNSKMDTGTNIHEVLEYLDFHNYQTDIDNYELSPFIKEKIFDLFKQPFMDNIEKSTIYKELSIDNGKGIIDLLIENDQFIVVDYKTKEIDKEEYIEQIKNYVSYIKQNTTKDVSGYLYSVTESRYIKVC